MFTLADRIKDLRKSKKLTQTDLGRILGVGKTTISMYENGNSTPNDEIKFKIAAFFDVTLDYLLGKSDIKKYDDVLSIDKQDNTQNTPIEDKLIEKLKNLDDESKKELEKYMDLLKLKESMGESKNETPSSLKQA
ncbi:helix-turn-helix domain-containing protein [Clostridium botulinum]|uniref:helix-turn-helix domain-containing protein n=1 Tax=Clostridium botulinum TaxID=1491 RepID=UPI000174E466|nr:helix-turn-helix domain-containing protein [Clostridium botulinum]ACD53649.1 transcriptional regulator [Clostridium botulinum E3 str. Alaska E43]MBY6949113.1 helix-turn-helix domain-containing protein [Clostridium botulinum]MBY7022767.1 helix-turn-helix domain-containing protein [Clostridium botulinum]MCR1159483.1 helix-turn-helix domain-containing protein [Clostridium botulinum]NFG49558.1 helix-turn-helix domain-containing protein [Clostridium botulinum]